MRAALLLGLLFPAIFAVAYDNRTSARVVSSAESALVQNYTKTLGKEWLKDFFNIDVDAFDLALQQFGNEYARLGFKPEFTLDSQDAVSQQPGSVSGIAPVPGRHPGINEFRLGLIQVGDIRQLAYDSRNVPFSLKMDTDRLIGGEWMKLETSFLLPLSWKGELAARASLPLPVLDISGIGTNWKLSSIYSNRMGISSVDAGLGTRWMGDWDLGFDSRIRFGQGIYETSQWLKLGRIF